MAPAAVKHQDIVAAIREMGLGEGHKVLVHSSLSSMGHVEGGAETVVEAFLEVLGPEGTLMVPTFTHSSTEYYDPLESPSKNGAITEAVRHHVGARRSLHPTHAAAVLGPDAEALLQDDLKQGALGEGCALDRFAKRDGWVFLLGVDHQVNSTIHIGEAYGGDPARLAGFNPDNPKRVILNHPQHGEMEVLLTSMMGNTVAFKKTEGELRQRGQIIDGQIGDAKCQMMKGQDVIDAAVDILRPIFDSEKR